MEPVNVGYKITFPEATEEFNYQLHPETLELVVTGSSSGPEWARLDHNKCDHCPLDSEEHPYCPLALRLHELVERFHDTSSIDEIELEVTSDGRRVIQTTSLQYAISAILETVYPASGCPTTALMRPEARFAIPAGTEEEQLYRIAGMYLLTQYFREKEGGDGDFELGKLADHYAKMSVLNKAVARRLKGATKSDSVKNAIALMDMYSTLVPLMLEDNLQELRGLFRAMLPAGAATTEKPDVQRNYLERIKNARLQLVPLDTETDDDEPEWLKEPRRAKLSSENQTTADKNPEPAGDPKPLADRILKNSNLTLELVPTENDTRNPESDNWDLDLPED